MDRDLGVGFSFSVDGVEGLWCEAFRVSWCWGSLYKHRITTLGKNFALYYLVSERQR